MALAADRTGQVVEFDRRLVESERLLKAEKFQDALKLCDQLVRDKPDDAPAAYNMARALFGLKEYALGFHVMRSVYYMRREEPRIWANIGHALAEMRHNEIALDWLKRAARAEPNDATNLNNVATVYAQMGRPKDAIEWGERALELDKFSKTVKYNLALPYLAVHRWVEGWAFYDEILGTPHFRPDNSYGDQMPRWDGRGGNVVIYSEQGLGDTIMFGGMIEDAIADADRVILDVDIRLLDLFKRSFPAAHCHSTSLGQPLVVPSKEWQPTHQIAVGSLGGLYRLNDDDFPGTPYLVPDPERVTQWRALLEGSPKPWIGINWKGGSFDTGERERSLQPLEMLPLLDAFPDATFVALGYQPETGAECAELARASGRNIRFWPRATRKGINYDETAGLIGALDCVVSCQTTAVHAAGAMGKAVWTLIPDTPQWRYGTDGDTIPWYASMRLVRQDGKVWPDAVMRAADQVLAWWAQAA